MEKIFKDVPSSQCHKMQHKYSLHVDSTVTVSFVFKHNCELQRNRAEKQSKLCLFFIIYTVIL